MMVKRSPTWLLLGALLVMGCGAPPTSLPPSQEQPRPPQSLGGVLITFSGLSGVGPMTANAQSAAGRTASAQALTGQSGLSLSRLSQSTFTYTDPADGKKWRYLTATFRVTPTTTVTNLSFVARVNTTATPKTQFDTPIVGLAKFDGSPLDNPQAFVQQVRPAHSMRTDGTRLLVNQESADMQAWSEDELASYGTLTGAYLLPYGFVTRNASGGRTISPSSPGTVTFSMRIPKAAAEKDDAFSFGMYFEAVKDDRTRVTRALEEDDGGDGAIKRATSIGPDAVVNLFPGTTSSVLGASGRVLCEPWRLVGPVGSPIVQRAGLPKLVSRTLATNAESIPVNSTVGFTFDGAVSEATQHTVPLLSRLRGRLSASYATGDSGKVLTVTPSAALLPGEVVDVSVTRNVACPASSFRVRAATKPSRAVFDAKRSVTDQNPYVNLQFGRGVTTGDSDGDGSSELFFGQQPYMFFVAYKPGEVTTIDEVTRKANLGGLAADLTTGDVDGDGHLDLLAVTTNKTFEVVLGPAFASTLVESLPDVGERVTTGDFDGDGVLDVALARGSTLDIRMGLGTGRFRASASYPASSSIKDVTSGDFDGDGKLDLAASTANGKLEVLLGSGSGQFSAKSSTELSGTGVRMTSGDFNGDGNLDIAVVTSPLINGKLDVLLGAGTGGFVGRTSLDVPSIGQDVTTGDFDGDSDLDLALVTSAGKLLLMLGTGTGTFGTTSSYDLSSQGNALTSGDFNGDGRLDVAAVTNSETIDVFLQANNFAGALSFGGGGRVTLADDDAYDFDTNQNFTIETWVKTTQASQAVLIGKWSGGVAPYPFEVRIDGGFLVTRRYDGTNNPGSTSTRRINDGKWHHVAFVKDGSTLRTYVDGQVEATATDTTTGTTKNTSVMTLGARGNDTLAFTGVLDEVRVWNVARTQAELQQTRGVLAPTYPASLVTYLKLDEIVDRDFFGTTFKTITNEVTARPPGVLRAIAPSTTLPQLVNADE